MINPRLIDYLQHLFSVIGIEASRIDGGTSPNVL